MRHLSFRIVAAVTTITILLGIYTAKKWSPSETATDFYVYYTAASLVRSSMSLHIYDGAERNTNPQLILANPATVYAQTANAHGISEVMLYLYPPTLADLVLPLTVLSPSAAFIAWTVLGFVMMLPLSTALARMLGMNFIGATGLVAAFTLLFRPTLSTIHWGEVSIVLTFLLVIGFSFYVKGRRNLAALLFALAIAIKLVPLIVILPLIAWRDWKGLRSLAIWCAVLLVCLWVVNGREALTLFFLHQLPAMSGGDLGSGEYSANRSLGNIFYTCLGGVHPVFDLPATAWLVRVSSVLLLCYASWLSRSNTGENLSDRQRFEIAAMFLLLACAISPYSWLHSWVLSAPAVVVFCQRAWELRADVVEIVLLTTFLISLSTNSFHVPTLTPLFGIGLGIYGLYRLRFERVEVPRPQPDSRVVRFVSG